MMKIFDDEESRENGIHVFKFTEEDIVRSALVKYIVTKVNSTKKKESEGDFIPGKNKK
jgi:hypothetical protein